MVHIGIIPDGNRRWCKANNVDYMMKDLQEIWFKIFIKQIRDLSCNHYDYLTQITSLSFYVCSIENIKRKDNTLTYIYTFLERVIHFYFNYELVLRELLSNEEEEIRDKTITFCKGLLGELNVHVIGDLEKLPPHIFEGLQYIMEKNKNSKKYNLYLAVAYDFKNDLHNLGTQKNSFYTREQSDIDIVLRSGGEYRLSGFFPAHINYAEFFFVKPFWPDITMKKINDVVCEFMTTRQRRFGM